MDLLSRRSALHSLAAPPLVLTSAHSPGVKSDALLLALGRRFSRLAIKLDDDIDVPSDLLQEFSEVEEQIISTPATTLEGLGVKARVTCWALLGDLEASDQSTANERMALSIVRDLIRLCDPSLERPHALKRLINDNEQAAQPGHQFKET
jgi:hypothetical protein